MQVAIVAKDTLLGEALVSALTSPGGFSVAGNSTSVHDAVRLLHSAGILVVVGEGFGADDWVQLGQVRISGSVRVVLVADPTTVQVGPSTADAVALARDGLRSLFQAVRVVSGGDIVNVVRESAVSYGRPRRGLTRREYEVAQLVAKGFKNNRISTTLGLREQSVKNLVSSIMRKLNCENRTQVALKLTGQQPID